MPPGFNMEAMNSMFQNPAFQNMANNLMNNPEFKTRMDEMMKNETLMQEYAKIGEKVMGMMGGAGAGAGGVPGMPGMGAGGAGSIAFLACLGMRRQMRRACKMLQFACRRKQPAFGGAACVLVLLCLRWDAASRC